MTEHASEAPFVPFDGAENRCSDSSAAADIDCHLADNRANTAANQAAALRTSDCFTLVTAQSK